MSEKHEIIIIGGGPAGYTAAIYAARANLKPILFQGMQPGGQLTTTTDVENFPGFPDGIMGPDLMLQMQAQAKRFGCELINSTVTAVDLTPNNFTVTVGDEQHQTESLIIATGANPRLLGLPAEKELMGYGVSTCATCDGAFFRDQNIAVIGGGDSACEEAIFLTKFGKKVYLIHRRDELRASKIMQERVLNHEKIEVIWNSQLIEVIGSKEDGVQSIKLFNKKEESESQLDMQAVFIAIGHIPNSQLFADSLSLDDNGYIVTKPDLTATNIPGVFACGDVQDHVWRQAITAAGSGCMAAIEAERWLESMA